MISVYYKTLEKAGLFIALLFIFLLTSYMFSFLIPNVEPTAEKSEPGKASNVAEKLS